MPAELFSHVISAGAAWTLPLRAGREVLLTAGAGANLTTLVFGPDRVDRLNLPDTLKAQMASRVAAPMVLMSDRGLALVSVTASSLSWHDALCGIGAERHLPGGATSYQHDRNDWRRSARALLLSELRKHGLDESDLHGPVNFFSRASIGGDPQPSLTFEPGHCRDGDWVVLRAELDVLLVMSTAPHALDPGWTPGAVTAVVRVAAVAGPDDPSRRHSEQAARALEQSRRVLA